MLSSQKALALLKERTSTDVIMTYLEQGYAASQNFVVAGWVFSERMQKKMGFIKLTDSSASKLPLSTNQLQIIVDFSNTDFEELRTITIGCSLLVSGKIVKSKGKDQSFELNCEQFYIFGKVDKPDQYYSIRNELTLAQLRDLPHLDTHTTIKSAIMKVRFVLAQAINDYYSEHNFLKVDMPTVTFSECEGGCEPLQLTSLISSSKAKDIPLKENKIDFSKDFFGSKAFVTVSSQCELETYLPMGNIWTETIAMRGEESKTSKHLGCFRMIEHEQISADSDDIIKTTVGLIKYCIEIAIIECKNELEYIQQHMEKPEHVKKLRQYLESSFVVITHAQAVDKMIESKTVFKTVPSYGDDLSGEHENFLVEYFDAPVIVRKYPKAVKAFYMPVVTETFEESKGIAHVDSFDILFPGVGELVGGSQRIHNEKDLIDRINELGLDIKPLDFYVELRRKGTIPHGGMGMGFERLIMAITGVSSVKDCVPYPRYFGCSNVL